jgi:hypothetical protein
MDEERKSIYDDLKRDLHGFPVEDFVRAYFKAYLEADVEALRKLWKLLGANYPDAPPDAPRGAPLRPRPNMNSGAIALSKPDDSND